MSICLVPVSFLAYHLCLTYVMQGAYDKAREAIAEVLKNARTLEDKFVAYMHQLKCDCAEVSELPFFCRCVHQTS